jgi:HK97 family phage major capsid protein/HK97 family phage prohead protease
MNKMEHQHEQMELRSTPSEFNTS